MQMDAIFMINECFRGVNKDILTTLLDTNKV